MRVHGRSERF
jgi:hypothetical protein